MYIVCMCTFVDQISTKIMWTPMRCHTQWNLSDPDTNGAKESVIVSEVSSLKCMQEWYVYILGVGKVERCPQFRGIQRGPPVHLGLLCRSYCMYLIMMHLCYQE